MIVPLRAPTRSGSLLVPGAAGGPCPERPPPNSRRLRVPDIAQDHDRRGAVVSQHSPPCLSGKRALLAYSVEAPAAHDALFEVPFIFGPVKNLTRSHPAAGCARDRYRKLWCLDRVQKSENDINEWPLFQSPNLSFLSVQ